MHRICTTVRHMKNASIPSIRVKPELREQLEQVLHEGESLSAFVETSVRESIQRRAVQAAFVQRGIASLDAARHSGRTVSAATVLGKLEARLATLRARKVPKASAPRR